MNFVHNMATLAVYIWRRTPGIQGELLANRLVVVAVVTGLGDVETVYAASGDDRVLVACLVALARARTKTT